MNLSMLTWAILKLKNEIATALANLNPEGGLGTLHVAERELEDALQLIKEARICWYEKQLEDA